MISNLVKISQFCSKSDAFASEFLIFLFKYDKVKGWFDEGKDVIGQEWRQAMGQKDAGKGDKHKKGDE